MLNIVFQFKLLGIIYCIQIKDKFKLKFSFLFYFLPTTIYSENFSLKAGVVYRWGWVSEQFGTQKIWPKNSWSLLIYIYIYFFLSYSHLNNKKRINFYQIGIVFSPNYSDTSICILLTLLLRYILLKPRPYSQPKNLKLCHNCSNLFQYAPT